MNLEDGTKPYQCEKRELTLGIKLNKIHFNQFYLLSFRDL